MAVACIRKQGASRFSRLGSLFAAGLLGVGTPAMAMSSEDADQAGAASAAPSRWSLPPTNVARRGALLAQPSRMTQLLVSQGSLTPAAVATAAATGDLPRLAAGDDFTPTRRTDVATAAHVPNVFGSVALAIGSTPLDAQWRRAGAAGAPGSLGRWTAGFARPNGANTEALLGEVNRWVNSRLTFTDDAPRRGQADQWAGADASLSRGRGDCEDYAIAKMQLLSALGLDRNRMFLVIARDLVRRADHAVLVVQVDDRFLVLDNMTDAVLDSNRIADYRPIMSYSASGRWIHGYERQPAPVRMATQTLASAAP